MSSVAKAHRYLAFLFLALGLVQFFLAGFGTFGEGDAFDVHSVIGSLLGVVVLVLLVLAFVGRREAVPASVLLFVLMIAQTVLGATGYDVPLLGALHTLNALALLGVASLAAAGSPLPSGGRPAATPRT